MLHSGGPHPPDTPLPEQKRAELTTCEEPRVNYPGRFLCSPQVLAQAARPPLALYQSLFADLEVTMALTPRLRAEREVEELRKSIRQMFRYLASLKLTAEDRAATVRGIEALRDHLTQEVERFERGEPA
jgi:hypothetical protein